MDRNTVIGFILIGILMVGMFYVNSKNSQAYQAEQQRIQDSINRLKPKVNPLVAKLDSLKQDSLIKTNLQHQAGGFNTLNGEEKLTVLENEVVKLTFTNKGAQPKTVELKAYKKFDGTPLILENGSFNKISYNVNTGTNQTAETANLTFDAGEKTTDTEGKQHLKYLLKDSSGKVITHEYILTPNDYLVDFNISLAGADNLISKSNINLLWQTQAPQLESSITYEKEQANIGYLKDGKYDFEHLGKTANEKTLDKDIDWVYLKQQFFISAIVAKNKFENAVIKWTIPEDSLKIISNTTANLIVPFTASANVVVPLQLYYGPSDYDILKKHNNQMQNIVPYGSGPFAFVKYINRHLLLPAFDFLRSHIASMGMVILLITLLIRLITSPILYKSYVSSAKMKALKPEIDKLKEKHGDDKQAFSMDQMKLWKQAGVSPLGGCLPALLQIPIFMSLYYFFQSNIALRGQSFLWAKNLAAYDSIYNLPFTIPFYGDHVSLFTILATVTSLLISVYSMNNMQDNSNPAMKYMPYIFPVMMLGIFNRLPSALTWYYTISNTITLILQIVIQKYIINHDKILADIQENKKKPVKQSKLQERIQAMQNSNQKIQDLKNKSGK